MQKPSHYGFRLSPAFTVASNRKRLCRPPGLCRVLKQCVSGCNGERSENKRKAFGRSRERRGGCRRQTDAQKKSYKYKFSFFFSDRNSKKKDLEL